MLQDQEGLFSPDTPLIFADGTNFYKELEKEFIRHDKGYFVLAPSGVGKSHYVRKQEQGKKDWIDADRLWRFARAMPKGAWWEDQDIIPIVEQQCDIITLQAKRQGFWMLGSANYWLKPDAIVLPHWQRHVKFIKKRELNYDGGAKSDTDSLAQVKRHRQWINKWIKEGVPKFSSVKEAVTYLSSL